MRIFTEKFKLKDRVVCIKRTNPIANMQARDTGTVFEVDASFKKYGVRVDNKTPPIATVG